LFHGKSVSIIAAGDSKDIAFEFVSEGIGFNLLAHSFFEEYSAFVIIVNVDRFSGSVDWIGD
jgi:hypothetical protein